MSHQLLTAHCSLLTIQRLTPKAKHKSKLLICNCDIRLLQRPDARKYGLAQLKKADTPPYKLLCIVILPLFESLRKHSKHSF